MATTNFSLSTFLYKKAICCLKRQNTDNISDEEREIITLSLKKYCDKIAKIENRKMAFRRKLKRIFKKVENEIYAFQNLNKEMRKTYETLLY